MGKHNMYLIPKIDAWNTWIMSFIDVTNFFVTKQIFPEIEAW